MSASEFRTYEESNFLERVLKAERAAFAALLTGENGYSVLLKQQTGRMADFCNDTPNGIHFEILDQ